MGISADPRWRWRDGFPDFVPFLIAYFQAHALAERARAQGWRPEESAPPVAELRPRRYGDYIPWWWELLPLALIGATAAYLAYTYPDAPDPFPTHFDINGNPNAVPAQDGWLVLPDRVCADLHLGC